jgi:hypothetical protein
MATQDCPHCVSPVPHWEAQLPSEQTWPAAQTRPQPPQLLGSLLVSVQLPRQRVSCG